MVALGKIKVGEPASAARLTQEGVDVLQWLHQTRDQRLSDGMQAQVVVADEPLPVLFSNTTDVV